jgi:hypothetical protein
VHIPYVGAGKAQPVDEVGAPWGNRTPVLALREPRTLL